MVLEEADVDSLRNLGQTCSVLRCYAIPMYLAASNLQSPSRQHSVSLAAHNMMALPVWRGYRGFAPPEWVYIWISHYASRAERQMNILVDFFLSLDASTTIHNIVVDFGQAPIDGLLPLLDAVRNSGVRCLSIDHTIAAPMELPRVTSALHIPNHSHRISYPSLTDFRAATPLSFSLPLISWTIHSINFSPLTSLDLTMELGNSPCWRLILPHISLPSLKRFFIDGNLPLRTLHAFLQRHLRVQALGIGRHARPGFTELVPPRTPSDFTMSCLTNLEGPITYLLPILAAGVDNLSRLSIFPDINYISPDRVDPGLKSVMRLAALWCLKLRSLSIMLPADYYSLPRPSFFDDLDLDGGRPERQMAQVWDITITLDTINNTDDTRNPLDGALVVNTFIHLSSIVTEMLSRARCLLGLGCSAESEVWRSGRVRTIVRTA